MVQSVLGDCLSRLDKATERKCFAQLMTLLGNESGGFPGSQPINLLRAHLKLLRGCPDAFMVGGKTDGVRCLLALASGNNGCEPAAFVLDRRKTAYAMPSDVSTAQAYQRRRLSGRGWRLDTVVDCEYVTVSAREGGKIPLLVAFDLLAIGGRPAIALEYHLRRERLLDWFAGLSNTVLGLPLATSQLQLEVKPMVELRRIREVTRGGGGGQSSRTDGLIFVSTLR